MRATIFCKAWGDIVTASNGGEMVLTWHARQSTERLALLAYVRLA